MIVFFYVVMVEFGSGIFFFLALPGWGNRGGVLYAQLRALEAFKDAR